MAKFLADWNLNCFVVTSAVWGWWNEKKVVTVAIKIIIEQNRFWFLSRNNREKRLWVEVQALNLTEQSNFDFLVDHFYDKMMKVDDD